MTRMSVISYNELPIRLLEGKIDSDAPSKPFVFNKIVGHNARDKHDRFVHDPIVRPTKHVTRRMDTSAFNIIERVVADKASDKGAQHGPRILVTKRSLIPSEFGPWFDGAATGRDMPSVDC